MAAGSQPPPITEALPNQVREKESPTDVHTTAKACLGYPESLLIYHAGVGRTVFVGCLKVTTLILFVASCTVLAPRYYYDPQEPGWAALAAVAAGAVPMLYVRFSAKPFVSFVHIKLPLYARRSKEALFKWAQDIPPKAQVDMTTMRFYGGPRVSRMSVGELRQTSSWLSAANLTRDLPSVSASARRSWWSPRPLLKFYVGEERVEKREVSIWQQVLKRIPKDSTRTFL